MNDNRRFAIALSFPGEHRRFVRMVAARLAETLGRDRVFFDEWYEAELRGSSADLKLKRIYREQADLVVPFFSEHYEKMWCQIEWHSIRVVLAERRRDNAVVPVHFDGTRIDGWESIDLGIRRKRQTAKQIADAIVDVYQQRVAPPHPPGDVANDMSSDEQPILKLVPSTAGPTKRPPLVPYLERSLAAGGLHGSFIGSMVLTALRNTSGLELASNFNQGWYTRGIRRSDEYYVRVKRSAGRRDWQRALPKSQRRRSSGWHVPTSSRRSPKH